jgi:hypothetical protein
MDSNASLGDNNIISGRRMSRESRIDTIDIAGKRFGKLVAREKSKRNGMRGVSWVCQCDCGKRCEAYGGHLRAGQRVSCGCSSEEKIEITGINKIMSFYKRKSSLKGRAFNLSFSEFRLLIQSQCHYCGIPPRQKLLRRGGKKLQLAYNGIDRIDSKHGYEIDNCVSACRYCNQAKSDLSVEEFMAHIKRIALWLSIDFS